MGVLRIDFTTLFSLLLNPIEIQIRHSNLWFIDGFILDKEENYTEIEKNDAKTLIL